MVDMATVRAMAAQGRVTMVIGKRAYDFTAFLNEHPGAL
jgi:cytochrome b involved in lipid metabolism